MDLDSIFVRKVLQGGPDILKQVTQGGIHSGLLFGDGKRALDWALEYQAKHKDLPSLDLVEANTGVPLADDPAALGFLQDEILKRGLWIQLKDNLPAILSKVDERDPRGAFVDLVMLAEECRKIGVGDAKVESLLALGEEIIQGYFDVKAGKTGILTPWPTMNEMTLGLWPEELTGIIARPSVGKTFFLTLMARHAWVTGRRVLLVSTEMSKRKMAFRFFATHLRLPYKQFRKGKLDAWTEQRMQEEIRKLVALPNLAIIGGDFDMTVDGVDEAVRDYKPEILFIDGAYLLRFRDGGKKMKKEDRSSRVAEIADDLKRGAKRHGIPYVFSSQFNREAKKADKGGGKAGLENIGFSDAIGQNADNLFALDQDDDMKADRRLDVKPLKLREGEGLDVHLKWDFENMDFNEEGKSADALPAVGPDSNPMGALKLHPAAVADPDEPEQEEIF